MYKLFTYISLFIIAFLVIPTLYAKFEWDVIKNENPTKIKITKFVDGDTFWAIDSSKVNKKYRLIGIDAPETVNNAKNKIHPYGKIATEALKALLSDSIAYIEFDKDSTDRYKRYLVYVYNSKRQFLNYELLRNGHATVMNISPNTTYKKQFLAAQDSAILEHKGLWR